MRSAFMEEKELPSAPRKKSVFTLCGLETSSASIGFCLAAWEKILKYFTAHRAGKLLPEVLFVPRNGF